MIPKQNQILFEAINIDLMIKTKLNNDNTLVTCNCIRPKLKQAWEENTKKNTIK